MSAIDIYIQNLIIQAEAISKTNWLQAVNMLERATDSYPLHAEIYITLGDIYNHQKNFENAIKAYQKALTIRPQDEYLLFVIGNCYLALSEYRMALTYFEQIKNTSAELYYNQALCLAYLGQHNECINNLHILVSILPDNLTINHFLIEELMRAQRFDDALYRIEWVKKHLGQHHHILLLEAFIWNIRRIWLKSYYAYMQADKLKSIKNIEYLQAYAEAAKRIGNLPKAAEILQRALTFNQYSSNTYEQLLKIYLELNDIESAKVILNKAEVNLGHLNTFLQILREKIRALSNRDDTND